MGMNVSTKWKDNKTVMGHKSDGNYKRNITRLPEHGSELDLRTENNKTEQANKKHLAFLRGESGRMRNTIRA